MFAVRPVVWHFVWWLVLAPLLLLELRALQNLQDQLALNDPQQAQHVRAHVTGERSGTPTMVRYSFELPGDATSYSATDMIGRRELWMPVDPAIAAHISGEKALDVIYLPGNPWVNQPAGRTGNPVADGIAGWVLFLLIDLVWAGETFLIARNYLRCTLAAERREPVRMRFWRTVRV